MPNKIISVKDYKFISNKTYFFDNNVWINLFAPLINLNKVQQSKASNFLKNLLSYNPQIVITSLLLSEFSNTYLRFRFEQWKKLVKNPLANYKRDYKSTNDFKDSLDEAKTLINEILSLKVVSPYPDNFNSINLKDIFDCFEIDFNDSYYYQQCKLNNWILVTSDNDFDNIDGNVTIIKI